MSELEPAASITTAIQITVTCCIERGMTLDTVDTLIKREFLLQSLDAAGNNQSATADNIGIHRNTLMRHIKQYAVPYQRTWRNRKVEYASKEVG